MTERDPARPEPPDWARAKAEEVVRDILDHTIDDAIKELASIEPLDVSSLADLYVSLRTESDRSLAIVLFAYVDDVLRSIYLKALNPKIDGGLDSLLGMAGPLSSAGLRIQMAYALRWIEEEVYRNLRLMGRIRNAFAHSVAASSFEDAPIKQLVHAMHPMEDLYYGTVKSAGDVAGLVPAAELSTRLRFHVRAIFSCSFLIMQMTSAPFAIRRGLQPMALLSRGYDRMAPLHQTAMVAATKATGELLARPAGCLKEPSPGASAPGPGPPRAGRG